MEMAVKRDVVAMETNIVSLRMVTAYVMATIAMVSIAMTRVITITGSKASSDKHTGDSAELMLPIVLSVSVVFVLAAVLVTCVAYRKYRSKSREPQEEPKYEVTVNAGCTDGKSGKSQDNDFVSHKPSYLELTHVTQSRDHPVYQGLLSRDQHELKSRDIGKDNAGQDGGMYQTLNVDTSRIYQPLNKTDIDNVANNAESPVRYGNLQKEKSRVDDSELYLTILPDHDVSGQSNVIYDNRYQLPDNSTNSPVLYGNVSNGEGMINQGSPHEYLTVLPDDKTFNQPTYEILPAT
ncbi:hypothetical protein AC249_AIPGENE12741 [Exaiptasia diaphana]|nr:hypothetical protein AC249_AIPGENE12741 [Exaiptasia diaphana]